MGTKQRLEIEFTGEYLVRVWPSMGGGHFYELSTCTNLQIAIQLMGSSFRTLAAHCGLKTADVPRVTGYAIQVICVKDSKGNTCKTIEGQPCILAETFVAKPATRPLATSKYKF